MSPKEEDITLGYLKERRPSIRPHLTSDTVIGTSQKASPIHSTKTNDSKDTLSDSDSDSERGKYDTSTPTTTTPSEVDSATHVQASGTQEFSLPRVDGGLNAYLVLISGFCIEGVVWGIPFSYSVMQQVKEYEKKN